MNFLSIHRLVSIVDTANYSGVFRELNHANRLVTRYTVVCKESEKERRKHAALWGTSVKNNRFGERVVDLDRLRPVKKKVESPVTDGRMHIQIYKFIKQLHRNYGVKGRAKVHEKNPSPRKDLRRLSSSIKDNDELIKCKFKASRLEKLMAESVKNQHEGKAYSAGAFDAT